MGKDVWYVERTWSCSSCRTANKGREIRCSQCGNPKEKDEAASDQAGDPDAAISNPELLKLAQQAPHWTCEFCDSNQRAPDGNCASCGGGKAKAEWKGLPKWDPLAADESFHPHGSEAWNSQAWKDLAAQAAREGKSPARVLDDRAATYHKHPYYLWAVLLAIVVVVVLLAKWLFTPHEIKATVEKVHWVHLVKYEERTTQHGEDWGTPTGSFNKICSTKLRKHKDCNPHDCRPHKVEYKCRPKDCRCHKVCVDQKNGFDKCHKECDTCYDTCTKTEYDTCYDRCPVYDDWCTFDYYQWQPRGELSLKGDTSQGLKWPDLGTRDDTHRSQQVASYMVHFKKDSETFSWDPNTEAEFAQFNPGQRWKCEKAIIGGFKPLGLER